MVTKKPQKKKESTAKKTPSKAKKTTVKSLTKKKQIQSTKVKIKKGQKNTVKNKKNSAPLKSHKKQTKRITRTNIENMLKDLIKEPKKKEEPQKPYKTADLTNLAKEQTRGATIIFDTNFLLIPEKFKIDIFEKARKLINKAPLDLAIIDKTIYELQEIAHGRGKDALSAKVALELINAKKLTVIASPDERYVDDLLVGIRDICPNEPIIATQDKTLKRRLKAKGIAVIVFSGKSKLEKA